MNAYFSTAISSALSDKELVARYQTRQEAAVLHHLIQRHKPALCALAYRFGARTTSAEDLVQDMYLILAEKLPQAHTVKNFRAWLMTLVRNRLIDEKRRGDSFGRYQNYEKQKPGSYQEALDTHMDEQQLIALALALLNKREQQCMKLFYLEGKTYHEIAEELGWSFRQVTGLMYRAMKRLRKAMRTEFGDYYIG